MVAMKVKRERKKDWIGQEATALQALFSEAERLMQTGLNTGQALRAVKKRRYVTSRLWPHRSLPALRRRLARWQAGGRTLQAARLGFKPGKPRVDAREVARVGLRCLATEAGSLAAALKLTGRAGLSYPTILRRLPRTFARRYRDLARARRRVADLQTELAEALEHGGAR